MTTHLFRDLCYACFVLTMASASASTARAGAASGDDIIIFQSTHSERYTRYFQTAVQTPNAKVRGSQRVRGYVILNLTTGDFRQVEYWTETGIGPNGRRVRVKRYRADNTDSNAEAIFQTGPDDRRNYLILSLYGTGKGNNYSFSESTVNDFLYTDVNSETLEGRMRVQRIRTALGIVECMAPSTIRGATGYESQRSEPDGRQSRFFYTGRKTLRIDKRRISEAKDQGASSVETFQDLIKAYLESRGYENDRMG